MGNVIRFAHQARASAGSGFGVPSCSARASNVIFGTPRSDAKRDKASQCVEGMPRSRQLLTVESACESSSASAFVPPRASIMKSDVIMASNIVRTVRTCQGFATGETTFPVGCGAIGASMDPPEKIGRRLIALRYAVKYGNRKQAAFAEETGLTKSTYNPFELGERPLTFEAALLIRRRWGVSLDWLFFGEMAGGGLVLQLGPEPEDPRERLAKDSGVERQPKRPISRRAQR